MVAVAIFFVLFTISNRPEIIVELWPLPYIKFAVYLLRLFQLFGFMAGVIITFFFGYDAEKVSAEKKAGNLKKNLKN